MAKSLFCITLVSFIVFTVQGGIVDQEKNAVNRMPIPNVLSQFLPLLRFGQNNQVTNVKDTPVNADACDPNPCLNYGVCVPTGDSSYRCDCLPFFAGDRCGYGQCIPIPSWPRLIPQPFYRTCTHPEICVLEMRNVGELRFVVPSCVCDDIDLCSEA